MPPTAASRNRLPNQSKKDPDSPNLNTATRPNTCHTGQLTIVEDHQEVKDSLEGRKFLEKLLLLCPPGEPPTHVSLVTCLHQISAIPGVQKTVLNAIRHLSCCFLIGWNWGNTNQPSSKRCPWHSNQWNQLRYSPPTNRHKWQNQHPHQRSYISDNQETNPSNHCQPTESFIKHKCVSLNQPASSC